jgi:hypothetical protein
MIPREEIQNVMGPGIRELMATIAAQGIAPAGPWFSHHVKMAPAIFDFEISVPVTAPVIATGRVRPSQWSATKVARTVHHGPYEDRGQRAHAGPGSLGMLRDVTGVEPRPGHVAHGTQPNIDRSKSSGHPLFPKINGGPCPEWGGSFVTRMKPSP